MRIETYIPRKNTADVPVFYEKRVVQRIAHFPSSQKTLQEVDIIVLGDKKVTTLPFRYIPRYPVFLNSKTLALTPIQAKHIGEMVYDIPVMLGRIAKIYGIIINYSDKYANVFSLSREAPAPEPTDFFRNCPLVARVELDLWHIPSNSFGWMGDHNKEVLSAVIQKERPPVIVELGTWLGTSAKHIQKVSDPSTTLICVDFFRSPFVSSYVPDGYHPMDRFYNHFMRFETFHRNLSSPKEPRKTFSMRYDCFDAISLLKKYDVKVALFYVDFEKKTEELKKVLRRLTDLFPHATIVGDDLVFRSVYLVAQSLKDAQLFHSCYVYRCSFKISTPKSDQKKDIIRRAAISLDCDQHRKYRYDVALEILKQRPSSFMAFVRKYKLKLNKPIKRFHMRNTLYHVFYYICKKQPSLLQEMEKDMMNYEALDKVKNLVCLTAQEVRDYRVLLE